MAKSLGVRTLTVIRTEEVDRLSDDEAAESTHQVTGCAVIPRTSYEEGKGWVIVEGRQVFAPYGSDILPTDEITLDNEVGVWSVDGAPGNYESTRGKPKAMILYLEKVS